MTIPDTLTDDLKSILGIPCFSCGSMASILRHWGHDIPKKAEQEQAAVLYWLLGKLAAHGVAWREKAEEEFRSGISEMQDEEERHP